MMKINQKEIENILLLDAKKRYEYFIKKVADWEGAWGLYNEGWALAETDENEKVFLLWPAKEYADLCATGEWGKYESSLIELSEIVEELVPTLKKDNIHIGIFYTPRNKGIIPEWDRFINDLKVECQKYE